MTSTPGTGARNRDLAQSPTGVDLADPAQTVGTTEGGVGPSLPPRSEREELWDADEHTITRDLIDLRSMWIVVNADDARIWPPQRAAAVATRTWCQIKGLLPW